MHTGKGVCDAMRGFLPRGPAFRRFRGIMNMGKTPDDPHVYITIVRENMLVSMCFIADDRSYAVKRLFIFVSRDKRIGPRKHQLPAEGDCQQ